jgi:hypothetical protein
MDTEPDLEIAARVKARELRFACRPRARAVAYSDSPARAEMQSERENMPDTVDPGVVYRDIAVRWRATVTLQPEPDAPTPGSALRGKGN